MSETNKHIKLIIIYLVVFIIYQLILVFFNNIITFDVISYTVLLIIIILPLFPYIDEIKIGFLSIKKKIDEFKQDVDQRILSLNNTVMALQNTIITSINQKQEVNLNVNVGPSERGYINKALNSSELQRRMENE